MEGGTKARGRRQSNARCTHLPPRSVSENQFLSKGYIRCAPRPDFGIPKEARTPPPAPTPLSNTRAVYTAIIFIAAISFEPRFMQWFLMSEPKQPTPLLHGGGRREGGREGRVYRHPARVPTLGCDAIFSLKRFICEPRRGAALPLFSRTRKGRGLEMKRRRKRGEEGNGNP